MSEFRNKQGKWITKGLFFELTPAVRPHAVFTLKDEDYKAGGKEYISLKKRYLSYNDPTEYEFAKQELGGWNHWEEMLENEDILFHVEKWRREMAVKLQSEGAQSIWLNAIKEGNFQASKWLVDRGWVEKPQRGRPSKKEVTEQAKAQAARRASFAGDLEIINGSKKA